MADLTGAIPTRYVGVQFRSRLEARWAAWFTTVGWEWQYRWRCTCGDVGKRWHAGTSESGAHASAGRRARNGGARHVAAMERAK